MVRLLVSRVSTLRVNGLWHERNFTASFLDGAASRTTTSSPMKTSPRVAMALLLVVFAVPRGLLGADPLKISSPAFGKDGEIPAKYTRYYGLNVNPPLEISGVPANTKSLALIVEDPDALPSSFVLWLVWNIDPQTRKIEERSVPSGAVQGGRYDGPYGPTPNQNHHYHFKIFALNTKLDLRPGAKLNELNAAMRGHVIERAELIGIFTKKLPGR